MKISLSWLKELVEITISPEDLAKILTIAGFEVEDIEDRRPWADGVVVGKVLERQPHPNADKLSVCLVDIGEDTPSQIVCGASNVRGDIYVPVAKLNTYLPKIDLKIKKAKLRGVESVGMICSLTELGLEKESEGIYIFEETELKPGTDVRPLLGLDDVILDLTATANRADALSMVGVAREVAALTGGKLHIPQAPNLDITQNTTGLKLHINDSKVCPAYIGTVMENLKIAPSPDWLKWRLQAAGIRPINNVVDITNYILLEWGQPLHAFDKERLQHITQSDDLAIGVRFAQEGESLTTLDGQKRELTQQNLLITANDYPVALAGVMGGKETEVYENTKSIVLEGALFDSVTIRRSSRSQSLRSEASTRYERGVNQAEFHLALNRAISLLQQLAQGQVISQQIHDYRPDLGKKGQITLRLSRLQQILGQVKKDGNITHIGGDDVERILTALGCELNPVEEKGDIWEVKVPPYRYRDLEREIDLIEEVARLYGYDHFCDTLPSKTEPGYLSLEEKVRRQIREVLRGVGLTELMQYSLVKPEGEEITLANPLFSEYSALRTDLISGLVDAFSYNQAQGNGALNGFEVGRIFWLNGGEFQEADAIAGILGGDIAPVGRWTRSGKPDLMTWYEAKGVLETVFQRLGLTVEYQGETEDKRLHPGRTASLWLNGEKLGIFGQIHPQLRQEKDLIDEVYVFELRFELLLRALTDENLIVPHFKAYSTYPVSERDLAFFADQNITVSDLAKTMNEVGGELLSQVELFDQYQGENVPEGKRSLAFNLVYRGSDRTLKDEDIEPIHQKVRDTLTQKFNVMLRS
jgi:phenylalanyl-tRNA synthetase beta chain